eukprot:7718797-Alexandrium_andersonii.AAC.1
MPGGAPSDRVHAGAQRSGALRPRLLAGLAHGWAATAAGGVQGLLRCAASSAALPSKCIVLRTGVAWAGAPQVCGPAQLR